MSYDSSRQAGTEKTEEIEVTPEMISAGLSALFPDVEFHPAAVEEEVLARAFRAMAILSPAFLSSKGLCAPQGRRDARPDL